MAELPEPQVQIALLGLSPSHRDLLPDLFHDPRVRVRWVHTPDPGSPLGRLARLFGFPLAIDPSEGALAGIEVLIRPAEDGDSWGGDVPAGVLVLTDRELAQAAGPEGFRWETLMGPSLEGDSPPRLPDPPAPAGRPDPAGPAHPAGPARPAELPESAGRPETREARPPETPHESSPSHGRPEEALSPPTSLGRAKLPEDFPPWLPDMLSPRSLGGWLCRRIDRALDAPRPSLLIVTRDREYLGAFRVGMGRRSWAFQRHARQLAHRIARRSGAMPRDDEPGGGHSVVTLEQSSTVLLERCGLGALGAVAISLPIGRRQQVWLLLPKPRAGHADAGRDLPVARARLVLAAEREGLRLLARLLILHDRARRWRLMRRMWHRLSNGFGPGLR